MAQRTPEEVARSEGLTQGEIDIVRLLSVPGVAAKVRKRYDPSNARLMFERLASSMMEVQPPGARESVVRAFREGYLEAVRTGFDKLFD